jgi:hypothetical protein
VFGGLKIGLDSPSLSTFIYLTSQLQAVIRLLPLAVKDVLENSNFDAGVIKSRSVKNK